MKLLAIVLALAACSNGKTAEPKREPERQRRVVEPPSGGVRAMPPHAIRSDGVGPYKLGATVAALLDQLPSGPRITQFALPGVIQRDILRAEDDAILIGAEPQGKAMFVSVVRAEIARTEAGIHVGSTREELERALGAPLDEPDRAQDPRVVVPSGMKNARILLDEGRITAFVVVAEPERAKESAAESACTRPAGDRERRVFGICLTSAGELVRQTGDELAVLARDGEKPIARTSVPGLVYAAALRNPSDGRDDLVAVVRSEDAQSKTWSLVAYRLHEGKLVPVLAPSASKLYELTDASARWIGADIAHVELYLELAGRADSIEVGGLLTTREAGQIHDMVVISPVSVARRRPRPAVHEPVDAGTSDVERPPR
jgi:hypothetical protein